jgi:CPA1 family monovalent cation:H+ antiporter
MPGEDGRPAGALRIAAVAAWSAHRSAIALALALAVPATTADGRPFPDRDLVLALTGLLVVGSGLLQGTTLPALLGWAQLGGAAEEAQEKDLAKSEAAAAQDQARAATDPETAAAEGRQALIRLRSRDAIGDAALREADHAVTMRAHAEKTSEPT